MKIKFADGHVIQLLPDDQKHKGPRPPRSYRNWGRAIRIDNDVWNELVARALPGRDNANCVLRRVFGLPPKRAFRHSKPMRKV